jgi:FkbM family methyltransferase
MKLIHRRLRRSVRIAFGRDIQFPIQIDVPLERHGSDCGEWWICPRDVNAQSIVYSLGIGTDITFDVSLIERYGLTLHAFDPTPGSIAFVETQPLPPGFEWHELGVAARDGHATFFPPENPNHISHTILHRSSTKDRAIEVQVRRLETIMRELGHNRIDVLKMDIEGAEYEVIDDILRSGLQVQQLLVEFHHRLPGVGTDGTRRAVAQLNAAGYKIFFAADSGEEYSFIRNGISRGASP